MRDREIVIRFRLPQLPRKRWLVGAGALLLTIAVTAKAYDTTWIASAQPLSSTKLKADLDEIQTRLGVLETVQLPQQATLGSGWSNYSSYRPAAYYKDPLGIVHLQGVVQGTSTTSPVFKLLSPYWPKADVLISTTTFNNSASAVVPCQLTVVAADGSIQVSGQCPVGSWLTLEGITFRQGN